MDYKHRLEINEPLSYEVNDQRSLWIKIAMLSGLLLIACCMFFLRSTKPKDITPIIEIPTTPTPLMPVAQTPPPMIATQITSPWKTITVAKHDTLSRIFTRLNLSKKLLNPLLSLKTAGKTLRRLQPNQTLDVLADDQHQLQKLRIPLSLTDTLEISSTPKGFQEHILHINPETRIAYSEGIVQSTRRKILQIRGLNRKITTQLTSIFKDKINFSRKLHAGDRFHLLFEQQYVQNTKLSEGDIVAVEAVVGKNIYRAVRYVDPQGHSSYYTPDGLSLHKGFLRFPVHFTRVSSGFSLNRLNPITHIFRPHAATDFAAPSGTPIKATADGRVAFLGTRHGYGRAIMLKHFGGYATLYGHMKSFSSTLKQGAHVKQGQVIGYVGSTGNSTGPHLHYEFSYKARKLNPLTAPLPDGSPLTGLDRLRFIPKARRLITQLETTKPKRTPPPPHG